MTEGHRAAPPHGGLVRVAFDGAVGSGRKQLAFQAASVNVDNWSPYWIKLEPVEEYIPPFQHDVTISLPLINSYEFKCLAPPGLDLADIVLPGANAIPGNSFPVICVFSSTPSNNDAGFSALEAAENIGTNVIGATVGAGLVLTLPIIDTTNFNGIYLYVFPSDTIEITLAYDGVNSGGVAVFSSFYQRSAYVHEQLLITIPKLSKHIRIQISNNGAGLASFQYAIKPFIGAVQSFECTQLSDDTGSTLTPAQGDLRSIFGNGTVDFPTNGIINGLVTVTPRVAGAAYVLTDPFSVIIYVQGFGNSTPTFFVKVISRAFLYGEGTLPYQIPLTGLLNSQVKAIRVEIRNFKAAFVEVAFHHLDPSQVLAPVSVPWPYTIRAIVSTAAGVFTSVAVIQVQGMLTSVAVSVTTPVAGREVIVFLGSAATQDICLGSIPTDTVARTVLDDFPPIHMWSGESVIWVFNTAVVAVTVDVVARAQ